MTGIALNAKNLLSICVDYADGEGLRGRLYHRFSPEPVSFSGVSSLFNEMDGFFDSIAFPQAATETRSFGKKRHESKENKEEVQAMQTSDIMAQKGDKGTFVVHVQYRQNATWQGTVVWSEKKVTQNFRSALELLKLIDGALDEAEKE